MMEHMERKLESLWYKYREACPDPEPGPEFMPQLWQRIEARRQATVSLLFRRWMEVCVMAALALSVLVSTLLIPHSQRQPVYQFTYLDVLASDLNDEAVVLPAVYVQGGDAQ
jgi:hypothetical protein